MNVFECLDNLRLLCMCVRFAHFWTNIVQFWSHFGLLTPYLVPRHDWGKNTQYLCLLSVFTFVLRLLVCFKVAVILVFSHHYNCYYMIKVRKCLLGVSTFVRPWLFDMFQFAVILVFPHRKSYLPLHDWWVKNTKYLAVFDVCVCLHPWSFGMFQYYCSYFGLFTPTYNYYMADRCKNTV